MLQKVAPLSTSLALANRGRLNIPIISVARIRVDTRHARLLCAMGSAPVQNVDSVDARFKRSCNVAVIGAGAAGLVAARELQREGHTVTVFEQGRSVGGVWVYTDETEDDVIGQDPSRSRVHSSLYSNLRTNLPREVMAYSDFPFDSQQVGKSSSDSRRFCGHAEVCAYLVAFADAFDLKRLVRFSTAVLRAEPVPWAEAAVSRDVTDADRAAPALRFRWRLTSAPVQHEEAIPATPPSQGTSASTVEVFDSLVVCNGHYTEPRLPHAEGANKFPGALMHTHSYREPDQFTGQRVVVVGASASGEDISREIGQVARKVYLSARSWPTEQLSSSKPFGDNRNIFRMPGFEGLSADGSVKFQDGREVLCIDTVLFATGYVYDFPFLRGAAAVTVEDNRVSPLYQHVFPPVYGPTLSFIGLPWKVVPFPLFELQAKWIARALSGRVRLPPPAAMQAEAEAFYAQLRSDGTPMRFTHRMEGPVQWEYDDWLARQCGDVAPLQPWRQQMYELTAESKRTVPASYRDAEWADSNALKAAEAHRDALKESVSVAR